MAPQSFYLYVDEVDATFPRRSQSPRKALIEPQDQFWGDRFAQFENSNGYRWAIARHLG